MAAFFHALAVNLLSPLAESDVLCQATVKQKGALRHVADALHPARAQAVVQLLPIHQYPAAAGRVQAGQQADDGAFACARGADKANHAAPRDAQVDVLQGTFMLFTRIGVAEADMFEADFFPQGTGMPFRGKVR